MKSVFLIFAFVAVALAYKKLSKGEEDAVFNEHTVSTIEFDKF